MIIIFLIAICINIQFINGGQNLRTSFEVFQRLTNQFLSTVQPNIYSLNKSGSLIFNIIDKVPPPSDPKYYVYLYWDTYIGYIILIIIGILFIIFFTLVGWFFCCCRVCCHKCGTANSNHASKNIKCKRITFNVFLFIFSSLILVGAIVAMANNFIFLDSVKSINDTTDPNGNVFYFMDSNLVTLKKYITTLKENIKIKGSAVILNTINQGTTLFNAVLSIFINTFSTQINYFGLINSTNNFATLYTAMQSLAANLPAIASQHQTMSNNLTTYLNDLSSQLSAILNNSTCLNVSSCVPVQGQLQNLNLGFNTSNINYANDMEASRIANAYNISDLSSSVLSVIASVSNVTNNVNSTFQDYINSMIGQVNKSDVVANFQNFDNGSLDSLYNFTTMIQQYLFSSPFGSSGTSFANGYLYSYVLYAFYGLCALISLILLVVLLLYIGLCYGMCGEPSFEDASRCSKGTGSDFLMASVGISFIFGWLIMLVTMIMFIFGGPMNTEVCSYLTSTDPNKLQVVDDIIGYMVRKSPITIGPVTVPSLNYYQAVVQRCPNEPDLISAFQIPDSLLQTINMNVYRNYVEGPVNTTITNISNYNMSGINTTSLDSSLNSISNNTQQLQNLVSPATVNELNKSVTNLISVPVFLDNLNTLINDLYKKGDNDSASKIRNMTSNLNSNIAAMAANQTAYFNQKRQFDASVLVLNVSLTNVKFNFNVFKSSPKDAKNAAVSATQAELKNQAQRIVATTIRQFIVAMGDCKGMSTSLKGVVNAVCVVLLGPFNNIWMGIGWFLLFIIPAIIFSVKLAGMYRISHIESEFSAYNNAYMPSNQFMSAADLELIGLARPQKA